MLLSQGANAQVPWWLFPGSPQSKDTLKTRTDTLRAGPDTLRAGIDSLRALKDSLLQEAAPVDTFSLDIPDVMNIALLLPVKSASQKPSANFLEYYCGALMAVRDLGLQGLVINLTAVDTGSGLDAATEAILEKSDVLIGPVTSSEILELHGRLPEGKYIISPVEPKAAGLADSLRVIQAPVPWMNQIDRLVAWAEAETAPQDAVVLLRDNSEQTPSEQTEYLVRKLEESSLDFKTVYSTTMEGFHMTNGAVRFFVASDRDIFLCSAINNIANMASRKGVDAVLYSTSKIRSLEGMNATSPHLASARITSAYNIDYEDEAIRAFILDYRAFFRTEPSSFAFSGYDTVTYFAKACAKYGRQWYKKLSVNPGRGLQTDFKFDDCLFGAGAVNTAVRRVLYNPDLSMTLLQQ